MKPFKATWRGGFIYADTLQAIKDHLCGWMPPGLKAYQLIDSTYERTLLYL